ncbi:MAG: DedA family protein [Acidimicrobiales bacterium]
MIESLLDRLADLDAVWLYVLAFVLPFGETVALLDAIVPGEIGLVLLGAAAARAEVSLVAIIAIGSLGAFAGDSVSWYVGHRWGTSLVTRWNPVRQRLEGPLVSAERHFDRYGGRTVFLGRFVGALRAIVPLVAGTAGMPYRHFVPWNAMASVAWVSTVVVLGAVFGEVVADVVDRFGLVLTGLVVMVGAMLVVRHRRRAGASDRSNAT